MASWKLVYQFLAAIKLARILKRNRCIHLHAHFADTATQIAMYASALSGVPFTVMAHANDIFQRGLLLGRKAERSVRMVTISEYNRRYLENIGTLKDRLAVVRCGVTFPAMSRPVPMADRRPFRIGTLGRMVEKKGFDTLIKAVAHLKKSGHSVTLCIAGDGPLKGILHRLVHDLDLAAVTRFEGSLPHPQVAHWMLQFDAFVLACKMDRNGDMDGIPVVLMEAMSQSIPVVSTRISGIPELVVHERTGLLAEPDNHVDLARQIERLLMHRELGATMTASALEHVMQEFGQEKNIDRLIECFNLQE